MARCFSLPHMIALLGSSINKNQICYFCNDAMTLTAH